MELWNSKDLCNCVRSMENIGTIMENVGTVANNNVKR